MNTGERYATGAHQLANDYKALAKKYASVTDLPASQVKGMSAHEKKIFLSAFNGAFDGTCKDGGKQGNRESCSFAVAHAAVNRDRGKSD